MSGYNNYQGEAASYLGGNNNQGYHQQSQYHYAPEEHGHEFSSMISSIMSNPSSHQPAQDHEIRAAQASYQQVMNNPGQPNSAEHVGNAAAVQALQRSQETGGGMGDMIKMAMSMASKMSGSGSTQGGHNDAGKNQAIQQAAMMAVKLYMSKQSSGASTGHSGLGGSSSIGNMLGMLMGSSSGSNHQQQQQHSSSGGGLGAMVGSLLGSATGASHSSQANQHQQQGHNTGYGYGQQGGNYGNPQQSYGQQGGNYGNPQQSYGQQGYGNYSHPNQVPPQAQQHQSQGGTDYAALASGFMNKIFK
ncbi:hypothetical protein G6F46_002522 [Rhizopus delemar]|uniref:DUF7721 domain-containing protein n=3 Tax=Rhizopus TaxID=4842 RepID=I1BTP2_RHIO9|nr:hypothetical protein RO3G_04277 [Rhizopus delemar RA 99-880]KAG1460255.1 hypothetical protein G6F55_004279 [Rhizopus delemar]KAG1550607.1 hypothetical protein G6F51_002350 [Rhizopus arrhizus]KAG1491234.1 hypothetical protein G6F54_010167 [Rhizopus delemar]KAG1514453.1 hypothetical protein G6F53_003667 [Rhizopus delemar]|eukprot:EIE79572.1 hypothetical protein RO3G_04277 [Rhizopus delemar RA 99-880]